MQDKEEIVGQDKTTQSSSKTTTHSNNFSISWIYASSALVGSLLGFFAGASKTPIVATLLPLIFGLIGGVGGLYLAKVDFTSYLDLKRINITAKSTVAFCLACYTGVAIGIAIRSPLGWSALLPASRSSAPEIALENGFNQLSSADKISVISLEKRLSALNCSTKLKNATIKSAIVELSLQEGFANDKTHLKNVSDAAIELSAEIKRISSKMKSYDPDTSSGWSNEVKFAYLKSDLERISKALLDFSKLPGFRVIELINDVKKSLDNRMVDSLFVELSYKGFSVEKLTAFNNAYAISFEKRNRDIRQFKIASAEILDNIIKLLKPKISNSKVNERGMEMPPN